MLGVASQLQLLSVFENRRKSSCSYLNYYTVLQISQQTSGSKAEEHNLGKPKLQSKFSRLLYVFKFTNISSDVSYTPEAISKTLPWQDNYLELLTYRNQRSKKLFQYLGQGLKIII